MSSEATKQAFDLTEWRERFIRSVLRIASVLGVILISVSFPTTSVKDRILFLILYTILVVITILQTPYLVRAYLLLFISGIIGLNAILAWGPWADGNIFLLATVILASLLLDNKTDLAILSASMLMIASLGLLTVIGVYRLPADGVPATTFAGWGVYLADFAVIGILLVAAANMLKNAFAGSVSQMQAANQSLATERQSLEETVRERTSELEMHAFQLRAATSTARSIAETQDISELLKKAAYLISERFEYYHVGVFILDNQRNTAYLQASSSEAGKALMGQAYRVDTDRRHPLARAIEMKEACIISDHDRPHFYQDAHFPLTRSRMTIPLSVRGSLIGILDVHSDQPHAFSPEDAEILQTLADLTAISFDNVRLLEETRSLLSQVEAGSTYQTRTTWSKFTSRQKNAYLYTPAGVRPIFARDKTGRENDGLLIPIVLHGQAIGQIKLKRKGSSNKWLDRERDLVGKIANQVALALDNSRLVDEAQKNALRNQMITNFSTFVRETLDVEAVARSAASELRKVFDLKEAEILIGFAQSGSPTAGSNRASKS